MSSRNERIKPRRAISIEELDIVRELYLNESIALDFSAWFELGLTDILLLLPSAKLGDLEHELSKYMSPRAPEQSPKHGFSLVEQVALNQWTAKEGQRDPTIADWVDLARLAGAASAWRDGDIGIRGRDGKTQIQLCSKDVLNSRIHEFSEVINAIKCVDIPVALYEYVLINNLHPLTDGNGRLSRMVLNHRLRVMFGNKLLYIPWKECFLHTLGGYEIALRLAETQRDWNSYCQFMLGILSRMSNLYKLSFSTK